MPHRITLLSCMTPDSMNKNIHLCISRSIYPSITITRACVCMCVLNTKPTFIKRVWFCLGPDFEEKKRRANLMDIKKVTGSLSILHFKSDCTQESCKMSKHFSRTLSIPSHIINTLRRPEPPHVPE